MEIRLAPIGLAPWTLPKSQSSLQVIPLKYLPYAMTSVYTLHRVEPTTIIAKPLPSSKSKVDRGANMDGCCSRHKLSGIYESPIYNLGPCEMCIRSRAAETAGGLSGGQYVGVGRGRQPHPLLGLLLLLVVLEGS